MENQATKQERFSEIKIDTKATYNNIIEIIDKIVAKNECLYDFSHIDICISTKTDFLYILYNEKVLCNINYISRSVYEIEQDFFLVMQVFENMYDLI